MKNIKISALSYAISTALIPVAVMAQDGQEEKGLSVLEEIIVTAERRSQSLQDVPLSVSAFSDETRDRVGILSIQDMADFTPGVSYATNTDRPSIRGIGRQSNSFSLDSPVANYFDGVYTSSVQDAQRRPIFVERTEILRGPQGALSGRGSIAGAINTYSKRPTDEFSFEMGAYGENYSAYGTEVTISGPLSDWFRARLNLGVYRQDEGYFTNVADGFTEGDQPNNRENADYLFEIDITENIDMFLKFSFADYDETRHTGGSFSPQVADQLGLVTPTPYGNVGSPLTPVAAYGYFDPNGVVYGNYTGNPNPILDSGDRRQYLNNFHSRQWLDDHHNYTMHLNWSTEMFDIKWIAAHQNYQYTQVQDGDGTAVTAMTLPTGRVVDPSAVNRYYEEREWYSNEVTLTSKSDGELSWIVGVYQSNEDYMQQPFTLTHIGYDELATPSNGIVNQHGNASVFGEVEGETVSTALFGQVDYQFSDALKFTLGLRYNKDEKDAVEKTRYVGNNFGAAGVTVVDLGPPFGPVPFSTADLLVGGLFGTPGSADVTPGADPQGLWREGVISDTVDPVSGNRVRGLEGEWDAIAGTLGVDYTPDDDTLIYARLASGYRPGGFNAGFIASEPQVNEESVTSLELGYKATIAEQLQLGVSAFYYDFEDQQLPLPALGRCTDPNDLNSCTIVSNFFNIPKSENLGLEVEMTWAATDNLSFMASYGYLDATIKDGFVEGPDGLPQGFQNPDDPAAVLANANRFRPITGQFDSGYTDLLRWEQDISGNTLPNSPEHKVALNVSYVMGFASGDLTLSSNWVWRDDSYSDVFETEPGIIEGFSTLSARALWTDAEDKYTVILYGRNLTDEDARDSGGVSRVPTTDTGAAGQAYFEQFNLLPPRTVGIEVQYRLGAR